MKIDSVVTENPNAPKIRTLDAHARCDMCGAQGVVQVQLVAGELTFCKHHFERYEDGMNAASIIADDREVLLAEESGGAR